MSPAFRLVSVHFCRHASHRRSPRNADAAAVLDQAVSQRALDDARNPAHALT
ncbi:hypothetical protein ACFH04_09255 [Streptomyces noboritoensis]|uniref:Histidine phosphatase family protein n=1 Tax=Streptomyces noboritoensis TaxID=67337 RepID=A0ABV6THD4_9ACTN